MNDKYPTWARTDDKDVYQSLEERDGVPDYVLRREGNGVWRLKRRISAMSDYFETRRQAFEYAGGTLTARQPTN